MMNPEPANSNAPQTTTDDSRWWLKYAVRFVGSCSALASLALGATACITVYPRCLLAGILQMLNGVLVALIEAPCLCLFLDFAQVPSNYFDNKPPWHRSLLYVVAPAEQMRMKASSSYNLLQNSRPAGDVESGSTLPKSSGPPKSGVI